MNTKIFHKTLKPENGSTFKTPFPKGTGGSDSFRIPALVTLNDGTLVAAADARWDTTYDGGGLDTVVSISEDNGNTWHYSFVNYMGDNGNRYNGEASTCFIDPCLATDGKRLHLLCDLYPYGVALNGDGNRPPEAGVNGFDEEGHLLLSDNAHQSYDYALDLGSLQIFERKTKKTLKGYQVDPRFNLIGESVNSNLFFKDSPFQVQRTNFLYLISSEDRGKSWSAPLLLPLKKKEEQAFLAAPGRGLYTKDGLLLFPCYSYDRGKEHTSLIYCYKNRWYRTCDCPAPHSSESALLALDNGVIRVFYRHNTDVRLSYCDLSFQKEEDILSPVWNPPVQTDIILNTNTQLSALSYPEKVNNKHLFLLSAPSGPSGKEGSVSPHGGAVSLGGERVNGHIHFAFLKEEAGYPPEWLPPYRVGEKDSEFMYSCLSPLKNGGIALLYENHSEGWGAGNGQFASIDFLTLSPSDLKPYLE